MQQEPATQHLPIRRTARVTSRLRYRYTAQQATDNQGGRLSYALLIIILFQTLVLGLIAFFLGLLLLLNFGNLLYRPPSSADGAAGLPRTPTPSATTLATATVTNTIAPPTAVVQSAPTETPVPTPTAANGPSPLAPPTATLPPAPPAPAAISQELQGYANQVLPLLNNLQGALDQLRALVQNPNINDQPWVDNVKTQISSIQTNQATLQTIQAPPAAVEIHNGLLNALTACRTAADSLSAGIGNHDANSLATATPYTQRCFTQFPEAAGRVHTLLRQ